MSTISEEEMGDKLWVVWAMGVLDFEGMNAQSVASAAAMRVAPPLEVSPLTLALTTL
jgi:hypothetical protein